MNFPLNIPLRGCLHGVVTLIREDFMKRKTGTPVDLSRDRWIGRVPEQRLRRLRLVANDTRFLLLPGARVRNLASRILSLSLDRLSADMEAAKGHPVPHAETFADPARFEGTCRRAANRTDLGLTRGQSRTNGGWRKHGRPKRVFVRALAPDACQALAGSEDPAPLPPSAPADPPGPERLRSLFEFLLRMPECRMARGIRHSLPTVLAIAVAAAYGLFVAYRLTRREAPAEADQEQFLTVSAQAPLTAELAHQSEDARRRPAGPDFFERPRSTGDGKENPGSEDE